MSVGSLLGKEVPVLILSVADEERGAGPIWG